MVQKGEKCMAIGNLKEYLNNQGVKYQCIAHARTMTTPRTAESTHISGKELAKTVILKLDGEKAMAVLPANRKVNLEDLQDVTGSDIVEMASEEEFTSLFPDCEVGAMPPFGNLYGMEVFVSAAFVNNDNIAFNAGTHSEVIKLAFSDFMRLVEPKILDFAV
jgi:Ala-tRNA(Pro) deacylase